MGHHIIVVDGQEVFQSDKYPDLPPDQIILSFKDQGAWPALRLLGETHPDRNLGEDVLVRMNALEGREGS